MTMQTILDLRLRGPLDQARLEHFQKLLNLEPQGRLTDTEDACFGHRTLPGPRDERIWLTLWREPAEVWMVRLTYSGTPPGAPVVARCQAEVVAAATTVGLTVTRVSPEPAAALPATEAGKLPGRRALSARLTGGERVAGRLDLDQLERLRRALGLRRENGGPSGTEFGWRYIHWDLGNAQLLQLFDDSRGTEVALLFDPLAPSEEVMAGCRLQIAVAADRAGMTIAQTDPEPPRPATGQDWAAIAQRAATAQTLPELLPAIGVSSSTAYELVRGRLLAVTSRPEWRSAGWQLRRQVDDYLLGMLS